MCPSQSPRFEGGALHSQNSCYVKIRLISKNKPAASSEGYLSALSVLDPECDDGLGVLPEDTGLRAPFWEEDRGWSSTWKTLAEELLSSSENENHE